jgi:hypothetical protein
MIHSAFKEKSYESISLSSKVTIKTKQDSGIEVSFVDPVPKSAGDPRNGKKSPVVYVIFQSIDLPRKFRCAQIHLY